MSVSKIELVLPFGFQPDPILETATPEQRAIVLTTGCVALKALLFKTDSLSNEEAYKKATAEEAEKWSAEKSELEEKALREKQDLEDKNAAEVRQLNDKFKRKEEELTRVDTLRAKAEREAATLLERESQTLIDERTRTRSQVESECSREIERLTEELQEKKTKIEETEKALRESERRANEAALEVEKTQTAAEKDKHAAVNELRENLTLNFDKKIEEQHARLLTLTNRQSNSSLKGQDNEKIFGELLHKVFGISPDYIKHEHRIESGDHIIEWEGLKLMFENKNYEKEVPIDQVEKAIKDFKKHPECDVLIFVSEKSSIAKHQRPGHLDIDIVDGRAAIWIGEFNRNEDKVVYLQMIAQVIRQLANFQKRAKEIGDGDGVVEDYKSKITSIRRYFEMTNEDLKSLVKAQGAYQRAQKLAWEALKEQINTFKGNFDRRLQSAMKDENDEIDYSSTVDDSQINTAEKKKRKAAAQKATPKGKRNCDGQIDKSPTNTTFQNGP
jgi:chromosome segregation ATPase